MKIMNRGQRRQKGLQWLDGYFVFCIISLILGYIVVMNHTFHHHYWFTFKARVSSKLIYTYFYFVGSYTSLHQCRRIWRRRFWSNRRESRIICSKVLWSSQISTSTKASSFLMQLSTSTCSLHLQMKLASELFIHWS